MSRSKKVGRNMQLLFSRSLWLLEGKEHEDMGGRSGNTRTLWPQSQFSWNSCQLWGTKRSCLCKGDCEVAVSCGSRAGPTGDRPIGLQGSRTAFKWRTTRGGLSPMPDVENDRNEATSLQGPSCGPCPITLIYIYAMPLNPPHLSSHPEACNCPSRRSSVRLPSHEWHLPIGHSAILCRRDGLLRARLRARPRARQFL